MGSNPRESTSAGAGRTEPPATLARLETELSRTRLLLELASLPDLALEAPAAFGAPERTRADGTERRGAPPASFEHVARVVQPVLDVGAVGIALCGADAAGPMPVGGAGDSGRVLAAAGELLERVCVTAEPLYLTTAGGSDEDRCVLERAGAESLAAVPILADGQPRGALYAAARRPLPDEDLAFLALVAARVGLMLERADLTRAQREIDRQRAQAAARQEFLGIVTHELKTPVAVLKAYAELLLERAERDRRAEDLDVLRRMEDQAERLLGMVEQVLDLQRLDAGLFPLELSRVDLVALAARVVEELQLTAGAARLRVEAPPGVRAEVRADRRRLEQVLINLVQNAIRFSPPGEEVLVRVSRRGPHGEQPPSPDPPDPPERVRADSGDAVVVSVSDRGPGVAAADRERIFARFSQGSGGDRPHRGHTGLGVGLYIAREIALRHGGDLWLEPAAGPGATFAFSLPVSGPDQED